MPRRPKTKRDAPSDPRFTPVLSLHDHQKPEAIGARLRKIRESFGLKGAEIASILNITPQAWSNYETGGSRPEIDVAFKILNTFGVGFSYIYDGDKRDLPRDVYIIFNKEEVN